MALFIPLLKIMDSDTSELSQPFSILRDSFLFFGIPFELPYLLVAIVLLNFIGLALNFAQRSIVMGYSFTRFIYDINTTFIDGLLRSSWSFASQQATGVTTNQLINEAIRAGRALTHLVIAIAMATQIVIFLLMSMTLSMELMVVAIIFGGITMLIIRPLQKQAFSLGERLTETRNTFGFYTVDYLKNLKLIKATASESAIGTRLGRLQNDVCDVITRRQINTASIQFIIQVVPVLLVACAIWIAQEYLKLEIGVILIFLLFLGRTVTLINQFQQELISYLMETSAITDVDKKLAEYRASREVLPDDAVSFDDLSSGIQFKNASYCFDDADQPAIHSTNLLIEKGDFIALVGGSGAGKSTMIDMLCGLRFPTGGDIEIDGVDLRRFDILTWRRKIGYVTQDVTIFNDSIRANIVLGRDGISDQDLNDAVETAHLNEVIASLPDGLDTIMGESGIRLSGGQKQRLALARALAGRPALLLLDEATSALDNESERIIQNAIDDIAHRFTIVVVAHRLSTVRKADRIHVMEVGSIVESGTYDELLAAKGRFAQLHDFQSQ